MLFFLSILLTACSGGKPQFELSAQPTWIETPSPTSATLPTSTHPPATPGEEQLTPPSITPSPNPTQTALPPAPNAIAIPNPEDYTWQITAAGFNRPTGLVSAQDGTKRLFLSEQQGLIYAIQPGDAQPVPFLDLRSRVSTSGGTTRGLLGLAFHPDYAHNGAFFVHFTDAHGDIVVARYHVSRDPHAGDPDSEQVLLRISPPVGEHNGGDLVFGPDGYLYIGIGDGGAGGFFDRDGNAQNTGSLLGKVLRLDVDRGEPYQAPHDNPFANGGGRPEVWAYGLRNPWRFTFDMLTGDLYIADVGENQWEEVNFLPAGSSGGANLGWSFFEGTQILAGKSPETQAFVEPLVAYDHSQGCSIIGGKVYRGASLPEWKGVYFYGDYCLGKVWGLLHRPDGTWQNQLLFQLQAYITSFGLDEDKEIYLLAQTGEIYKLVSK